MKNGDEKVSVFLLSSFMKWDLRLDKLATKFDN